MINEKLVGEFKSIAVKSLSGSLEIATTEDSKSRFFFEEGHLIILDACRPKEEVLAETFFNHNKIDEAMYRLAVNIYQTQGVEVAETFKKQQLVTDEEIAETLRCMVEQILITSFSASSCEMKWYEENSPDIVPYDLDVSAMKLKIEIDMLLDMVGSRIRERDTINQFISNNYEEKFCPTGIPGESVSINAVERNVLALVDGNKTVTEIARQMRDSATNVACYMKSLVDHGLIALASSLLNTEAAAASGGGPQQVFESSQLDDAKKATAIEDFSPYTQAITKKSSFSMRPIILFIILAFVSGIGYLIYKHNKITTEFNSIKTMVDESISAGDFISVNRDLEDKLNETKDFVALNDKIKDLVLSCQIIIKKDLDKIEGSIKKEELHSSVYKLSKYPSLLSNNGLFTGEMYQKLLALRRNSKELQNTIESRKESAIEEVNLFLSSHQIREAIHSASVKEHPEVKKSALSAIDSWKANKIKELKTKEDTLAISEKRTIISEISLALPITEEENSIIHEYLQKIDEQENQIRLVIKQSKVLLQKGKWKEASSLIDTVIKKVRGSELSRHCKDIRNQSKSIETELASFYKSLLDEMSIKNDAESLKEKIKQAHEIIVKYSDAEEKDKYLGLIYFATELLKITEKTELVEEEIASLQKLEAKTKEAGLLGILATKKQYLEKISKNSMKMLLKAKDYMRTKRAEEARRCLESIVENKSWQKTRGALLADKEIENADRLISDIKMNTTKLENAMKNNDNMVVQSLVAKMKDKNLPIYISTVPKGAIVKCNGKDYGKTPVFIRDLTVADKTNAIVSLTLDGYINQEKPVITARGGWQIKCTLPRKYIECLDLKQTVTSEAKVIGEKIIVAGNRSVFEISSDFTVKKYWPGTTNGVGQKLKNPVYASASLYNENIFIPTRDRFALIIDKTNNEVTRCGLPIPSDLPVIYYESEMILDRKLIIVAGLESGIYAVDLDTGKTIWTFDPKAPIAHQPIMIDTKIIIVEKSGQLTSIDIDNGKIIGGEHLGAYIASASKEGDKVVGFSGKTRWSWDGNVLNKEEVLPEKVIGGTNEILFTKDKRIIIEDDASEWKEIGVLEKEPDYKPVLWNNSAVVVYQNKIRVYGDNNFSVVMKGTILKPVVFGGDLVLITNKGKTRVFKNN